MLLVELFFHTTHFCNHPNPNYTYILACVWNEALADTNPTNKNIDLTTANAVVYVNKPPPMHVEATFECLSS
jgi:hypothetical protein